MGYTTDFKGRFSITPVLTIEHYNQIMALSEEDRYFIGAPHDGKPDSYCQWVPTIDGDGLEWDGNEKFYYYVEWIEYIVNKILTPNGYTLSGQVSFEGEARDDVGLLRCMGNKIHKIEGLGLAQCMEE